MTAKAWEAVQPHAFFLQRLKETLDHPILLRRVRRDVLLAHTVAPCDAHKGFRPEDKTVVRAQREVRRAVDFAAPERILERACRHPR